ncbi:hypothetical protein SBA2_140009 [Acidobacteriia bacterium SbA2]|nr:hypothetical protein SBA2_140009 [Acidobacteriia bacterium SbA2]
MAEVGLFGRERPRGFLCLGSSLVAHTWIENKDASQTRVCWVAKNATLRAARLGPSATKSMSPQDDKGEK